MKEFMDVQSFKISQETKRYGNENQESLSRRNI